MAVKKKKAGRSSPRRAPSPPRPEAPEAESTEGLSQFEALLSATEAVDGRDVVPARLDTRLALVNVREGAAALLSERARIAAELPAVAIARLERLPDLALAFHFAAGRVATSKPASEVRAMLARAATLRQLLLRSAEVLALAGQLDARKVDAIQRGSGSLDVAEDCVRLAALFEGEAAPHRAKTPVTRAHVREASELGSSLLGLLKKKGQKRPSRSEPERDAAEVRDRFYALLRADWDLARRAAAWLFGPEQDRVRPLGSAPSAKKRAAPAPPAEG